MQKHSNRLWISVLVLGWLFDVLFFKHTPGISFAIFVIATLGTGLALLWLEGFQPARANWVLIPLILFFAGFTFLRTEPMSTFLALGLTLLLMAILAVSYRSKLWIQYGFVNYLVRGISLAGNMIVLPLKFALEQRDAQTEERSSQKKWKYFGPVVRGLLLAIPVVAFFTALLYSADLVFANDLTNFASIFRLEKLPEYILQMCLIALCAYALAGVYLFAAQRTEDQKLTGSDKPLFPAFLGIIETSIVLGGVVLLFALFVGVQFQYFFGGQANITISGLTYAEYARKGFGELALVAFFAQILFLGLSTITHRTTASSKKIFSGLGVALFLTVAIMLFSAYQRLQLYENAYGFTRLRTYTHVFMIWVAVLLAFEVILDLYGRQRFFALAFLVCVIGFSGSLLVLNVDTFIVKNNLARFETGQTLDVGYLASLSSDSVPAEVAAFENPSLSPAARDRVGAVLACIQHESGNRRMDPSWQAFNFSRYWADQAASRLGTSLSKYAVLDVTGRTMISSPLGEKYDCTLAVSN